MKLTPLLLSFVILFSLMGCTDDSTVADNTATEDESSTQPPESEDGSASDTGSETGTEDDTTPPVTQDPDTEDDPPADTQPPVATDPETEPSPPVTEEATDTPPSLVLIGASSISLRVGDTYTDAGATASDQEDGDLTAQIVTRSDVNTDSIGSYQVSYSVEDSDGNRVDAVRTVQVTASAATVNFSPSWESNFDLPPQDVNGWSKLSPSTDSRLIYVSSSEGDDATGQTYQPEDSEIGDDPFNPAANIKPFASIDAALAQTREDYPDYILLKRGDSWTTSRPIALKAGRSANERSVLSYYGSDIARPMVKPYGVNLDDASYSAVVGIQFTATQRNPASPDFIGLENVANVSGFHLLGGYGNSLIGHVLIEDCLFEWFAVNSIQSGIDNGGPVLENVVLRRNIIANNYSTLSHSQGIFSAWASVLLEENTFDHNGWYQQAFSGSTKADGVATMFNHNTYFAESRNTIFRNNLFIRSSSINNKFTSNTTEGTNQILSWNILVDNNLYVDGEIGISLGGNKDQDNGPRWRDIYVTNNIMMHIGRSQPTNRVLGWGLEIDDWDGGLVKGNIFTHWGDATVSNTYATVSSGDTQNVEFSDNIVHNVQGGNALFQFRDGTLQSGITFFNNEIDASGNERLVLSTLTESGGFHDNYFYSTADESNWFSINDTKYSSLDDYRTATGDNTSVAEARSYVDPERTLETYLSSIGYASDMDSFISEAKQQSKFHWRNALTAITINAYIREGFCLQGNAQCR
jgi:hypothetical protein